MGHTLTSGAYQVHSSVDRVIPPLESNREPNSAAGILPLGGPNFPVGILPTWRSGSSLCCGSYPCSESTYSICWWVTPPLQNPFQVCKYRWCDYFHSKHHGLVKTLWNQSNLQEMEIMHFEKPITARDIWYIHEGFLIWIIPLMYYIRVIRSWRNQAFWKGTVIKVLSKHILCICLHVLLISE